MVLSIFLCAFSRHQKHTLNRTSYIPDVLRTWPDPALEPIFSACSGSWVCTSDWPPLTEPWMSASHSQAKHESLFGLCLVPGQGAPLNKDPGSTLREHVFLAHTFSNQCCCSVTKSCLTLCNPRNWNMPGLPVPQHLPEFSQVHVHWISDATQPLYPLSPFSPSTFSLSQH